jgi:hypothetical protein
VGLEDSTSLKTQMLYSARSVILGASVRQILEEISGDQGGMDVSSARDVNLQALPSKVNMIETSSQRPGDQVNLIASDNFDTSQSTPRKSKFRTLLLRLRTKTPLFLNLPVQSRWT